MSIRETAELTQVLHTGGPSNVRETAELTQVMHSGGTSTVRDTALLVQVMYSVELAQATTAFQIAGMIG